MRLEWPAVAQCDLGCDLFGRCFAEIQRRHDVFADLELYPVGTLEHARFAFVAICRAD
jgi:hypothetical protein